MLVQCRYLELLHSVNWTLWIELPQLWFDVNDHEKTDETDVSTENHYHEYHTEQDLLC